MQTRYGIRSVRVPLIGGSVSLAQTNVAQAHPSGLRTGDAWWWAWHFDPLVATVLVAWTVLYGRGLWKIWWRAGVGRVVAPWRAIGFLLAVFSLTVALLSPLDTLSDDLSWVHMTQHMVLMVVAAPLLIAASPGLVWTWAMPTKWRKPLGRFLVQLSPASRSFAGALLWNPFLVWALHAIVLWVWHLPVLYEWALVDPLIHDIEHLSFFLIACLFWRIVLDTRHGPTLNPGLSVLYLFTTSLHAMGLGVLMTLSPSAWYGIYVGRTSVWGLSPLEDQQLAGAIMWMPACMAYAIVAAGIFANWLNQMDRRVTGYPTTPGD